MPVELPQTGLQFNTLMPASLPQTGFQFNSLLPPQQAPIALNAPASTSGGSMAWIGPAIGGVASLGGAAMGGKAQKKAAELQAQTADKALDFTKQQEAQKLQAYNQAVDLWKQQWNAQQARRDALLSSYGFSVPNTGSLSMPTGGVPPGVSGAAGMPVGMPSAAPTMNPALAQAPQPGVTGVGAARGGSLGAILRNPDTAPADLGAWSDWKRYGLA